MRVLESRISGHFEKSGILGIGARPPPLYVGNAEGIKFLNDPEFVFGGERYLFPLGAVPQCRVIKNDASLHVTSPGISVASKKNPLSGLA
jgi:hypothetical protein